MKRDKMTLTPSQLAKDYNLTKSAIINRIKRGAIKATKKYGRWYIKEKDFIEYRNKRYSQDHKIKDGKPIFDKEKGLYSAKDAAFIVGCPVQRIYYHLRIGIIKGKRYRASWIIQLDDLMAYKKNLIPKYTCKTCKKKHLFKIIKKIA
jgi:hypothetical protein